MPNGPLAFTNYWQWYRSSTCIYSYNSLFWSWTPHSRQHCPLLRRYPGTATKYCRIVPITSHTLLWTLLWTLLSTLVNPNTPSSSHSSSTFQTSSSSPLHLRTIPNAIHFDPLVIGNHSTPGLCILPMPISSSSSSTTGIHPFIKLDTPIPLRSSEDSVADRSLVFRLVRGCAVSTTFPSVCPRIGHFLDSPQSEGVKIYVTTCSNGRNQKPFELSSSQYVTNLGPFDCIFCTSSLKTRH